MPDSAPFAALADQWAVLLTTYRRDATPSSQPVSIVVEGDHAFFRTYEQAGKFKRLRRNPNVLVQPCTWRGKPTGPAIPAVAALLSGSEDRRAGELIDAKYPIFQRRLVRTAHRVRRYTTRHFELRAVED